MTTISAINVSKKYEYIQICQLNLRHSGINKSQITPVTVGAVETFYKN